MPTISLSTSVAANVRSGNVLAGSVFEFMPRSGVVAIAASGAAAGLEMDANIGGEQVVQAGVIPATNRFPVLPDDRMVVSGALAGQRLFIDYLNTTGGALVVNTLVNIAD